MKETRVSLQTPCSRKEKRTVNLTSCLVLCAALTLIGAAANDPVTYDFEGDEPGAVPAGFSPALSGEGRPGVWKVMDDLAKMPKDEARQS